MLEMLEKKLHWALLSSLLFAAAGFSYWSLSCFITVSISSFASYLFAYYILGMKNIAQQYALYILWGASVLYQIMAYRKYTSFLNKLCEGISTGNDCDLFDFTTNDRAAEKKVLIVLMKSTSRTYLSVNSLTGFFIFTSWIFLLIFSFICVINLFKTGSWFLSILILAGIIIGSLAVLFISVLISSRILRFYYKRFLSLCSNYNINIGTNSFLASLR